MNKFLYQVSGSFDFTQQGDSPGEVREKLIKILKQENFLETGFQIEIARIEEPEERPMLMQPAHVIYRRLKNIKGVKKIEKKKRTRKQTT